ncbi:MAG: hypothetical protein M0Z66_05795 [Thermaerobacter sp.]|nr:hypothetical protein [Thermaerobacter sp.]
MGNTRWIGWAGVAFLGLALAGCGTTAQGGASQAMAPNNTMGSSTSSPASSVGVNSQMSGSPGDVLVGAAASPPTGSGSGMLIVDSIGAHRLFTISLSTGANGFKVAVVGGLVYVPTLQGRTYVVSLQSDRLVKSFATPVGARIADYSPTDNLLVITGPQNVTAYSLGSLKEVWQVASGGNALSIVGGRAYLSGNMANATRVIDLKSGKIVASVPVGHIEDSVYDPQQHTLWLANWTNGDMTILDTADNTVVGVVQESEGGGFSMANMMMSSGGFMQLAVGPTGQHVYAASFSGNIMVYNAGSNAFEKDIPTNIPMAKLSGIGVDASGQYAYVTVESSQETVTISLKTGKVLSTTKGLMSNRWTVVSH